jgi:hypothetical protein
MTFTYTFANANGTYLKREDEQGNIVNVPADLGNRDYAEFLASGAEAAPYVAPPEPEPVVDPLEARIAALEANEIIDDSTDSSLLTLIASLTTRVTALENQ